MLLNDPKYEMVFMAYKISVDHKTKLIHYQHDGVIDKEQIGLAWNDFLQMKEFTKQKYNILSDYSGAKFNMSFKDVDLITNFLYSLKGILEGKKQALIILEPRATALSILFEGKVNEKIGFIVRIFSNKKDALEWLTE